MSKSGSLSAGCAPMRVFRRPRQLSLGGAAQEADARLGGEGGDGGVSVEAGLFARHSIVVLPISSDARPHRRTKCMTAQPVDLRLGCLKKKIVSYGTGFSTASVLLTGSTPGSPGWAEVRFLLIAGPVLTCFASEKQASAPLHSGVPPYSRSKPSGSRAALWNDRCGSEFTCPAAP